jgi:transposase InsO family protein
VSDAWRSEGAPDAASVIRAAERVADRLRVLGPRWAARDRTEDAMPAAQVQAALQRLADAAARAEYRPARPVPDLGPHVLADQVLVLARDAAATGDAEALAEADDVLAGLRAAL